MKHPMSILLAALILLPSTAALAQDSTVKAMPQADSADVASPEAIVAAAYDVISGPAGPRDWDRFRSLFGEGARLIPTGCNPETKACGARVLSPDDYASPPGRISTTTASSSGGSTTRWSATASSPTSSAPTNHATLPMTRSRSSRASTASR